MERHDIDPQPPPSSPSDERPADDSDDVAVLLAELGGLHHLAVRAEQLARAIGIDGADVLDAHAHSSLEQARGNARAIVASLDRAL